MMNCVLWNSVIVLSLVWAVGGQSSGDLRLVGRSGGTGGSFGRLEVYYSGQWGTVCQDRFGINDARVACRQLGFSSYTRYGTVGRLDFSQASLTTRTWLDELRCRGTESRLIDCPANTIGIEDCRHSQDVALICTTSPSSGDLRLVDNSDRTGGSSGRLEFYYNGTWGTMCRDSFSRNNAVVACRQLGFPAFILYGRVGDRVLNFFPPLSNTPILDELRCRGTESRLIDCPANTIGVENCTHTQDVGLSCDPRGPFNGELRLVNNLNEAGGSSGRLEVSYNKAWGTVCDNNFGPNNARVACRQLGYANYIQYGRVRALGFNEAVSTTRIYGWISFVLGTESRLINCSANAIGIANCGHSQDVALICEATATPTSSSSSSSISISIGVSVPVIIIVVIVLFVCSFISRRGRLARPPPRILDTNTTSTAATVTNTQNTAYSMNRISPNSNQPPPPNVHGPQPAAAYPIGQYAQLTYLQQPPAPEKPPPVLYLSGREAPPTYPG